MGYINCIDLKGTSYDINDKRVSGGGNLYLSSNDNVNFYTDVDISEFEYDLTWRSYPRIVIGESYLPVPVFQWDWRGAPYEAGTGYSDRYTGGFENHRMFYLNFNARFQGQLIYGGFSTYYGLEEKPAMNIQLHPMGIPNVNFYVNDIRPDGAYDSFWLNMSNRLVGNLYSTIPSWNASIAGWEINIVMSGWPWYIVPTKF